jgi:receptor protein-tyrosine kinase
MVGSDVPDSPNPASRPRSDGEISFMGDQTTPANLLRYVQVLARRIAWLVSIVVLCVVVAVGLSSRETKEYSATAQLLVEPASGSVPTGGTQQTVSPTDVLTDLQLVTSAPVEAAAAKKLGFAPKVTAQEVNQTNVVALTVSAPSPSQAANAANTYANTFVAYQQKSAINALASAEQQLQLQINSIDGQAQALEVQPTPTPQTTATIAALSSQEAVLKEELAQLEVTGAETPGGVEVVSPASAPTSPSSPKPLRYGVLALLLGLVLGTAAAFAAEYFDNKVYTKEQVERLTGGAPVLAMIPMVKNWRKATRPALVTEVDPFSAATEAFRGLRTSLQFAAYDGALRTILITSSLGGEGKTSIVANLGVVLAKAGERVVVVGCDLRRPRIGGLLGRDESPGFTSVVMGQCDLKHALQTVPGTPGLALLGTGPMPPNPAELLGSAKAAETFRVLASGFDVVLIDSPPLLPVDDARVLSVYADAVLLVVAAGQATQAQVTRATELLNVRPTGVVLNKTVHRAGDGYRYGSSYGYKYRYLPDPIRQVATNGQAPANQSPANQSPVNQAPVRAPGATRKIS